MRVLVVGGGISGLAAAVELVDRGAEVEVWEAAPDVGGKLRTSPFGGAPAIDEGADAYLIRNPVAVEFAERVGVGPQAHPNDVHAAVWWDELHRLPGGVMMGVPGNWRELATTGLLSWRGKARALADLVLPTTNIDDDSLGALIRARLGDEVHERLVDTLVGSIYATDTDRASLAANPQLATLADGTRSLILAARKRLPAPGPKQPIFASPRLGMQQLARAAAAYITNHGGAVHTGRVATSLERDGDAWRVDDEAFDAVVVATPAGAAADLLDGIADASAGGLRSIEVADIAMARLAIARDDWPDRLAGLSGYLVPKPRQQHITAASFGSQKWEHWNPGDHQIVRVSLGRDGLPIHGFDDEQLIDFAVADTGAHIGLDLSPTDVSLTRWTAGFPQYRPHHGDLVARIEADLPAGIALAGASYRGIGVPACITDGLRAARGSMLVG